MIEIGTKEIDGTVFQVRGLDLRTERAVLIRLTKLVGPALAELARAGSSEASVSGALRALFAGLEEQDVDYLIGAFKEVTKVQMTLVNGETWVPYVESVFKNGASSQLQWLWYCLEHQFAGFLGSGSGKLDELIGKFTKPGLKPAE